MFKIGNIEIKNQVGLAPMAGISNASYMKICEEMGVGWAVTELISSEAVVRNNKKTLDMLKGINTLNIPVGVQIFGSNPATMAKASKILVDLYQIAFIDINMGCPVPKVAVRGQAGAGLLKDPDRIKEIVEAVVSSVKVPVTVKIRSGWDSKSINAVEVAEVCERAGASAITLHARTRSQGYSGPVDLAIIKEVKEAVTIPVIGNGDVNSIESALEMLSFTRCDAVMIGRGALGNPWLLKEIVTYLDRGEKIVRPTAADKIMMCLRHLDYLLEIKPEKAAVLEMRSHICWYLKGLSNAQKIKNMIFQVNTAENLKKILNTYLNEFQKRG